jgi:hypothetical protein
VQERLGGGQLGLVRRQDVLNGISVGLRGEIDRAHQCRQHVSFSRQVGINGSVQLLSECRLDSRGGVFVSRLCKE